MMKGHEFLKKEFDFIPKSGWLMNSAGHSSTNARLYADMGIETLFLGSLSQNEMEKRYKDKSLNFLWKPSMLNFGHQKQLLVSTFKDSYCWPTGFKYDERFYDTGDDLFQPDATLSTFNAEKKSVELINYVQGLANHHKERHILLPWGCDYAFQNARENFEQMDKIIQFTNRLNNKNITFMYSTPSNYAQELKKDNISWPVKNTDAFPYSSNNIDYWTGYFGSRPSQKKLVRDLSSVFHASEKLLAKRALEESFTVEEMNQITALKSTGLETLGIAQEAITGTAK